MKNLFLLAGLSAILFASCSNDEEPTVKRSDNLTFEFAVVNKAEDGSNLMRSGLYSSEAKHKVSRVVVYAFKKNGADYLYEKTFDNILWPGEGISSYTYVVDEADDLSTGDYKLLAVGREATDSYTLTTLNATTNFDDFSASYTLPRANNAIFAGSATLTVGAAGGGNVSIQMTRQVAGLVGYFSNVPSDINGETPDILAIVVTEAENSGFGNTTVNLTTGTGSNPYPSANTLVVVDLRTQTTGMDGTVPVFMGNTVSNVTKLDTTQLNGSYIIPTKSVKMELVLAKIVGGQLGTPLRSWPVKMSSNGSTTFDIIANHYYTLGTKNSNTDTDDDTPINLNRNEAIYLTILPDWTEIHDLVID